jgi:predicted esterase
MSIDVHVLTTQTTGRFLVRHPANRPANRGRLVGFHGYGETAERHLEELERIPGADEWTLVSVFALHRFYTKTTDVVGSWMTRLDRERAIADNLVYVNNVLSRTRSAGAATEKLVFVGFSQGVAMAYRAAIHGSESCDGVIALGGDLPPELRNASWTEPPRILIGRGRSETFYTPQKLAADLEILAAHKVPVEVLEFDGGHEWTDEFRHRAGEFLGTISNV